MADDTEEPAFLEVRVGRIEGVLQERFKSLDERLDELSGDVKTLVANDHERRGAQGKSDELRDEKRHRTMLASNWLNGVVALLVSLVANACIAMAAGMWTGHR
jgi:hypothetical protein